MREKNNWTDRRSANAIRRDPVTSTEIPERIAHDTAATRRTQNSARMWSVIASQPIHGSPHLPSGARDVFRQLSQLAALAAKVAAADEVIGSAGADSAVEAHAQPTAVADNSGSLTEVIITAEKRASTVQDTPISISAVSGQDLQDRGITDVTSLAQSTPGVSIKSQGPGQTEIEMRGMTSSGGNSATVGYYLDDIPLTAPAGAQNGKVVI